MIFRNRKKVIIMLCYVRSGGTLLNRCLSSLPNTFVLSEINPEVKWKSGINKISYQTKEWFEYPIDESDFSSELRKVTEKCFKENVNLIVRDFSYGSFVPRSYNNFNPSNTIKTLDEIKRLGYQVKTFAFVRNARDVWLSMESSEKQNHDNDLRGYYSFVKEIKNRKIKYFKYENFCLNPDSLMIKICNFIDIPFDKKYKYFYKHKNVLGDIRYPKSSRFLYHQKINQESKRVIDKKKDNYIKNRTLAYQINSILGYTD